MDDEIKDMFFSPFSAEDNQNCKKKEDYTDFSVYLQCEGCG